MTEELASKYVELYDYPDRQMELRWKGVYLPYLLFSKDQRVSHTAIRRERATKSRAYDREGTAGPQTRNEGTYQQPEGGLPDALKPSL